VRASAIEHLKDAQAARFGEGAVRTSDDVMAITRIRVGRLAFSPDEGRANS
jgi:hypothetical protein